jgi:hypothetical protein
VSAICGWLKKWCRGRGVQDKRVPAEWRREDGRAIDPKLGRSYCGRPCPRLTPYVVVRFTDDFLDRTKIPYEDDVPGEKYLGPELWKRISLGDRRIRLRALHPIIKTERFRAYDAFVQKRAERPLPNLRAFYQITGPRGTDFDRIAQVLQTQTKDVIAESTYAERPALPPQVDPTGQDLVDQQLHLNAPFGGAQPGGINARAVWAHAGADGAGVRFADVERGWDLGHPDLPPQRVHPVAMPLVHGVNDSGFDDHGTGVLGIVCATDYAGGTNTIGGVGIAPRAEGCIASWFMGYDDEWNEISNIPGAILAAAVTLFNLRQSTPPGTPPFGEVLLVETAVDRTIAGAILQVPAEANFANWDQVYRAGLAGITVVAAGGNGDSAATSVDLDALLATDSGAILVSAAQTVGVRFERVAWAPRGDRVNCFAHGYNVTTCHSTWASPPYRNNYGGTSAAAAIVAGAAMCLQGLARVTVPTGGSTAQLLTSRQLRLALQDPRWSTAAMQPGTNVEDPSIGRMPDLGALWGALTTGLLHHL